MYSLHFKSTGLMPQFHINVRFLPCCCKKMFLKVLALMVGFWIGFVFASIFQQVPGLFRICSRILECFMIMQQFQFFNQLTNDHFLLFVFFFFCSLASSSTIDLYSWLRIYLFLIYVLMASVIHLVGGLFITFSSNGAQESRASKKFSVSICTWVSTLSVSYIRFRWLDSCISIILKNSGE